MVAAQVSLEEFLSNPDIHYYDFHELHNGEIVVVSPPSEAHVRLQERLEGLLRALLGGGNFHVLREYYYTLASNSRRAEVGVVLETRRQPTSQRAFRGGPDIVVEILSPTNKALDLDRLRAECFSEGTRQFWQVNPELETVTVFRPKEVVVYGKDDVIPWNEFACVGQGLPVNAVFVKGSTS